MEACTQKRFGEYNQFFAKNAEKRARIETLEEQLKNEQQQRKSEESKLRKRIDREKSKN